MSARVTKIEADGVYDSIPNHIYHGQLTPTPSISSSMAIALMEDCPRKLWHGCYLNPDFKREQKTALDLGTAGHLALLEPDEWNNRIAVLGFDDYKKHAAQDARDEAYAAGKTPLLTKRADQIMGLRAAVLADPVAGPAFAHGPSEQTVVCRDRKTGVWLKCRPDKRAPDWSWIADLKCTTSANPRDLRARAFDGAWFQRVPWYLDVVQGATGIRPSEYFFIAAETKPPHLVTVCRFKPALGDDPGPVAWGKRMNRRAIDLFAECVAANNWPSYTDRVVDLTLPTYAEYRLQERDDAGDFVTKPTQAELARAAEFHEPIGAL